MSQYDSDKRRKNVDRTTSGQRLGNQTERQNIRRTNVDRTSGRQDSSSQRGEYQDIGSNSRGSQPTKSNSANRPGSRDIYSGRREVYSDSQRQRAARKSTHSSASGRSKKNKKRSPWATAGRIALSVFLIGFIAVLLTISAFGIYVMGFVDDSIDFDLNDLKLNYTTTIYAKDDSADGGWSEYQKLYEENREWISISNIPKNAQYAFVAAEDQRFYSHNGVDWKRTAGSFVNMFIDIYGEQQGGSTITQQLVKNLTGDNEVSSMRKIREIMRARKIEMTYAKDVIMECYLNVINLGNGNYGIETAAKYYFGKEVKDLTINECACLAAITKSPANYEPINNPQNNLERRQWIIKKMHEITYDGEPFITEEEMNEALNEELVFGGKAKQIIEKGESDDTEEKTDYSDVNSYFTDTVIEQVIQDLIDQKGYTESYAQNMIYRGGLKIYSTVDTNIQTTLENAYKDDDNFAKVYGTKQKAESAMTIMDYEGHVVGIVGGRGQKTLNRGLNRAYQSPRQPGSTMKPIGVYAPGIEKNIITYSSKIKNTSYSSGGYSVYNYDRTTSSYETVQQALEVSLNIVPARILEKITPQKSYDFVTSRFGISTLVSAQEDSSRNDINTSAMALGGSTKGITTFEMAAAYCTFGNGGKYWKPTTYTLITDQKGKTILEQQEKPTTAISEDTANVMNHLLRTPVLGYSGTARSAAFGNWQIMAKTGTTTDNKDRWFIGGTPYYMAACWFGCDTPASMASLSMSGNPAQRLWKAVMEPIHKNLKSKTFEESDDVVYIRYCTSTGMVARSGCYSTKYGYFKKSYMPLCTDHSGSMVKSSSKPTVDNPELYGSGGGSSSSSSSKSSSKTTSKSSSKTTSKSSSKASSTTSSKSPGNGSSANSSKSPAKTESKASGGSAEGPDVPKPTASKGSG